MTIDTRTPEAVRKWLIGIAVVVIAFLPLLHSAITVPLSPIEQAQVSLVLLIVALVASFSAAMRPLIIFMSAFASARYFYWRITSTVNVDNALDAVVSLSLLGAEVYGLVVLFLGYFQTVERLRRQAPAIVRFPHVDVFIPTYNESVQIVRRTVIGALAIDYPQKRVHVLDDGRRSEIAAMARSLGCEYLTRPDRRHAKAGNLNHALGRTTGELVAIFDADHVPVRSFLRQTVGFFEDARVALVQTAHHFFNPDPYERNLNLVGRIAPEQTFFFQVIQPGNDFWNSAFFCGSSAVLRRSALDAIGGFKTETVTEDAHTALELHAQGFRSVYQPLPLAAGLATESFAAHVRQRMRWARGMAQILRIDCPLFKRGLSLPQRLNYFNAMIHFFFGLPRMIMIAAPLTYFLLGAHPLKANAVAVVAYILPHIGLSILANSVISKQFRHSFWAAVYEISIAPYTAGVTLMALVNPHFGSFNVTDKGAHRDRAHFDFATSRATLGLLGLSLAGLMIAFPLRLLLFSQWADDPSELDAILINGMWAVANFMTLTAAACVAYEQPQQRTSPRIRRGYRCTLTFGERIISCETLDVSEQGVRVILPEPMALPDQCAIALHDAGGWTFTTAGSLVRCDTHAADRVEAAFAFDPLSQDAHRQLVELVFCAEDSWTAQTYPADRPLWSLWCLLTTFWRVTQPRRARSRRAPRLRGRWRASYGEHECRCVSVSVRGAEVEFRAPAPDVEEVSAFCLELRPDRRLRAQGRVIATPGAPASLRLQFEWSHFNEAWNFGQEIYQHSGVERPVAVGWRHDGVEARAADGGSLAL